MTRVASLVLISPQGELLGMLPALTLPCPFWPESADVAAEVAARFGAQVVMLRLLRAERAAPPGGHVEYLAELSSAAVNLELSPVPEHLRERALRPHAKRMPWAELGGPQKGLAWAQAVLAREAVGQFRAIQQRTWNLSTLWRFVATGSDQASPRFWLKQVPHFMRRESAVLGWLNGVAPGSAPTLVASDDEGRSLLEHVSGDDCYGASIAQRQLIHQQLHAIQAIAAGAVNELLSLGVPDYRGTRLADDLRRKLLAWTPDYPGLDLLLRKLDQQVELLAECGLPDTLVHADNHPGNARGTSQAIALLDWGEAFIGNPVTDLLGLIGGLSDGESAPLVAAWCDSFKLFAPKSKPELAVRLAPFISAMSGAATYAHFLTEIEDSEWPYHRDDVPRCLKAAEKILTTG